MFRPCFSRVSGPPKTNSRPKFTPQKSSAFLSNSGLEKVFPRICLPKFWAKFGWTFWGWIPTKTLHFVNRRSKLFRKFLGRLRMILCYWKTFSVPNQFHIVKPKNVSRRFSAYGGDQQLFGALFNQRSTLKSSELCLLGVGLLVQDRAALQDVWAAE